MTQVTIEQKLADRLTSSRQRIEIRDEAGALLGYFVPALPTDEEMWERARAVFSDEEIERFTRENADSCQSWQEIRDELEAKWPST